MKDPEDEGKPDPGERGGEAEAEATGLVAIELSPADEIEGLADTMLEFAAQSRRFWPSTSRSLRSRTTTSATSST